MGPLSLTCFHLQNYLKVFAKNIMFLKGVAICDPRDVIWTYLNLLTLIMLHT